MYELGVYGDVQRVKILYNKKDSALIQMAEPQQAYTGKYLKTILQINIFINPNTIQFLANINTIYNFGFFKAFE